LHIFIEVESTKAIPVTDPFRFNKYAKRGTSNLFIRKTKRL